MCLVGSAASHTGSENNRMQMSRSIVDRFDPEGDRFLHRIVTAASEVHRLLRRIFWKKINVDFKFATCDIVKPWRRGNSGCTYAVVVLL